MSPDSNSNGSVAHPDAAAILTLVDELANKRGLRSFIVGGAVRDHLMHKDGLPGGQPLRDLDIVIEGDAREFALFANESLRGAVQRFDRFFTAKISNPSGFPGIAEVDFASTRTEIYESSGALPTVTLASIENDLRRRDFAINAMALPLSEALNLLSLDAEIRPGTLIDQFDGQGDLLRKHLKVLHENSFLDDPTRLFRAIRYTTRFKFSTEPQTTRLFDRALDSDALKRISPSRIFTEVRKIFKEQRFKEMLIKCNELEMFKFWSPTAAIQQSALTELISALSEDQTEIDLLRAICEIDSDAQPQNWGLSLSKKIIKEIMAKSP